MASDLVCCRCGDPIDEGTTCPICVDIEIALEAEFGPDCEELRGCPPLVPVDDDDIEAADCECDSDAETLSDALSIYRFSWAGKYSVDGSSRSRSVSRSRSSSLDRTPAGTTPEGPSPDSLDIRLSVPPPPPPRQSFESLKAPSSLVINLSSRSLSAEELNLLELGLSYVPDGQEVTLFDVYQFVAENARRLRINEHFEERPSEREELPHGFVRPTSHWNPGVSKNWSLEQYLTVLGSLVTGPFEVAEANVYANKRPRRETPSELAIIKGLIIDVHITIRKSDKGARFVIVDRVDYVKEVESVRHLGNGSTYTKLAGSPNEVLSDLIARVNDFIDNLSKDYDLPIEFVPSMTVAEPRLGEFYLLIKVHKNRDDSFPFSYPARGICSMVAHPCEKLSLFVHRLLKPLLSSKILPEFIQDTSEFLRKMALLREGSYTGPFENMAVFEHSDHPFTLDVTSMFTEIPAGLAADSCKIAWGTYRAENDPDHKITPDALSSMLLFLLTHTWFRFGTDVFSVAFGTAMGMHHSVALANIFMSAFFVSFFGANPTWLRHISFFTRFLDDAFGFWKGSWFEFVEFVDTLNNWSAAFEFNIQFTCGQFAGVVPFLDIEVYKNKWNEWHSRLYYKTSDAHAYLSPSSCHEPRIAKNIPLSVAKRVRRCCSEMYYFSVYRKLFCDVFFPNRGYDKRLVRRAFDIAAAIPYEDILKKVIHAYRDERAPFIFTYSRDTDIMALLQLSARQTCAQIPDSNVSKQLPQRAVLKPNRNLKNLLIKASLRDIPRSVRGCSHCDFLDCPLHQFLSTADSITSFESGEVFDIKGTLNCRSEHVIYVVSCHKCGVQGVGECSAPVSRLRTYIRVTETGLNPKGAIEKHLAEPGHSLEDLSFDLVYKLPPRCLAKPALVPALRKRYEYIWIHRLKAALNKRRFLWQSFSGDLAARAEARVD